MYAHKEEMKMLLWQFANVTFKATKQLKTFTIRENILSPTLNKNIL